MISQRKRKLFECDLDFLEEFRCLLKSALDVEGDHTTVAYHLPLGQLVLGVGR